MQNEITVLFDKYSIVHPSCQNVVYKVSIDIFDSEIFLGPNLEKSKSQHSFRLQTFDVLHCSQK